MRIDRDSAMPEYLDAIEESNVYLVHIYYFRCKISPVASSRKEYNDSRDFFNSWCERLKV